MIYLITTPLFPVFHFFILKNSTPMTTYSFWAQIQFQFQIYLTSYDTKKVT